MNVMVLLFGNHHRVRIIAAMHDSMTDMCDLVLVDVGFLLEEMEEMGKGGCMIGDGGHGLVACAACGRFESEFGGRG